MSRSSQSPLYLVIIQKSSLRTAALIPRHAVICFYLLLKYLPAISYGTAFEDACEPQLGNSFFEEPHLFIFCQGQALHAQTFYTFHSSFKIYLIWRRVNSSFCTHSCFSFSSFLSLSLAFCEVHRSPFSLFFFSCKLYRGASKDTESPLHLNVHTSSFSVDPKAARFASVGDQDLEIRLIIRPTALRHKSESGWLMPFRIKRSSVVGPPSCYIGSLRLCQWTNSAYGGDFYQVA